MADALRAVEDEMRAQRGGAPGPTEPADYAAINAVYAALLAGLVYATRGRSGQDPIVVNLDLETPEPASAGTEEQPFHPFKDPHR